MSDKRESGRVERQDHAKNGNIPVAGTVRLETAVQRAVASVRQMSRRQRRQSLIKAGILTSAGRLAPNYR